MKQFSITLLILILLLLLGQSTYATCPVPAFNDITHEYYVFEDSDYIGIGWRTIPERQWDDFDKLMIEKNYRHAANPYLIDEIVLTSSLIPIIVVISFFIRKRIYLKR